MRFFLLFFLVTSHTVIAGDYLDKARCAGRTDLSKCFPITHDLPSREGDIPYPFTTDNADELAFAFAAKTRTVEHYYNKTDHKPIVIGGRVLVMVLIADYKQSNIGAYKESIVGILSHLEVSKGDDGSSEVLEAHKNWDNVLKDYFSGKLADFNLGLYMPYLNVTTEKSIAAGEVLLGFHKTLAKISWKKKDIKQQGFFLPEFLTTPEVRHHLKVTQGKKRLLEFRKTLSKIDQEGPLPLVSPLFPMKVATQTQTGSFWTKAWSKFHRYNQSKDYYFISKDLIKTKRTNDIRPLWWIRVPRLQMALLNDSIK